MYRSKIKDNAMPRERTEPTREEVNEFVNARLHLAAINRKKFIKMKKGHKLKVGDLVLVRAHHLSDHFQKLTRKLFLLYEGPFKISEISFGNCYTLVKPDNDERIGRFNASLLRPYYCEGQC